MMYYQPMSAPPPQPVTSQYPQHPTLLQPCPQQYSYNGQYAYGNGLTSPPMGPGVPSAPISTTPSQPVLPLPNANPPPPLPPPPSYQQQPQGFDTTGQLAPPGMKPRVTATLWEDEGSLCFQVEARGICVARREDNHMINGTKLLNVAGMTRGRRDGILKSEKVRHVVKIGPMHLKGVWIPFERALDFANKEKITELLYPLFVHNISSLLCHPANQSRTSQVMAAAARKQESLRSGQPGLPSLQHHQLALPGPQPPLSTQPPMGPRPSFDRAHSFPTPPTSATSVIGSIGSSDSFQWSQSMSNGQATGQITIDTNLGSNARSLPQTPTTAPPVSTMQSMQSMQSYAPTTQPYDTSRPAYQTTSQPPYQPSTSAPYERRELSLAEHGQLVPRRDLVPPLARPSGSGGEQQVDTKPPSNGIVQTSQNEPVSATGQEEEADHDGEYTHDSGAYDANRGSYNYNIPPVSSLPGDHSHLSSDISGSPHQAGSGRATPRTAATPQQFYPSMLSGTSGVKRGRDEEEDRSTSDGAGMSLDAKRRKTMLDGSMPSPTFNAPMAQPPPPPQSSTLATAQRHR